MAAVDVRSAGQGLVLSFPGGAALEVQFPRGAGPVSALEVSKQLMAQGSAVLAPLKPTFDIITAIISIKDFAEAVPGIITNPGAVADAVADLVENVAALAQLIPQLSMPVSIVSFLDVILTFLRGVVNELGRLDEQQARIDAAAAVIGGLNPEAAAVMQDVVDCGNQIQAAFQANLEDSIGPMNSLIELINIFMALVGLEPIPAFEGAVAVEPIEDAIGALRSIRAVIPV